MELSLLLVHPTIHQMPSSLSWCLPSLMVWTLQLAGAPH